MNENISFVGKEIKILVNSRIIQFFMIVPLMYLSYRIGRQMYIEYLSYKYPGYYIKPHSPIKDKLKVYAGGVVKEILTDKEVEKEGLNFLARLFVDPQIHEAAVILLKNVLQDPRFIDESKVFGVDLISSVVRSPICQEDFKLLVIKTLQEDEVKRETVEVLRYIIGRAEAEDMLALYFKTIFLRDDMLKGVTGLLTKASIETLESPKTREKFGQFALLVAGNENVKSKLYQNYLYNPAKRLFSFGLITGEDEPVKPVVLPSNTEQQQPQTDKTSVK